MSDCIDRELFEEFFEGIYTVDRTRTILTWNKAAERITGWKAEEVIGKRCMDNILRHVDYQGRELCVEGCPLHRCLIDGKMSENNVFLHHKEGHRVPVTVRVIPQRSAEGGIIGAMELFIDRVKRMDYMKRIEGLQREAMTDPLTGIGNRRFGDAVLERARHDLDEHGMPYGVVLADIDRFKRVNDRHGHAMGDKVLAMCAQSMLQAIRTADSLCRWGGEEFLVVVPAAEAGSLRAIAERIRFLVELSWMEKEEERISVTISVGATLAVKDEGTAATIDRVDKLLYRSKEEGRNRISIG